MEDGSNTLTATVTTPTGQTSTATITVASDGIAPFLGIEVSTTEGVSPLPATYTLTNRATTDATVTFNEGTSFVISPGQEDTAPGELPRDRNEIRHVHRYGCRRQFDV